MNQCIKGLRTAEPGSTLRPLPDLIHLLNYIESRTDDNSALFVSLNKPHSRLTESGVELRLREMGKKLVVEKVHPHKCYG